MRSRRTKSTRTVVCRLEMATVTVDYRDGRVLADLVPPPSRQHPVVRGQRWRPSWGSQELGYGWLRPPRSRGPHLLLAALALAVTLTALRSGRRRHTMVRGLWLVRLAQRRPGREGGLAECEALRHAVRWVGVCLPMRVACLEESVATALALALLGRRVVWCHGVSGDPIEFHAWLRTTDGRLIAEPASTRRFRALLTVPAHHETPRVDSE